MDAPVEKMTAKQRLFADLYLSNGFNATKAARDAGYSERSASIIGFENLRKHNVKIYIDQRLEELSLGKGETLKAISDIARGSLNAYFRPKQILHKPKVKIGLDEFIERRKTEIEMAGHVHDIAKADELLGTGKQLTKAINAHKAYIRDLKLEIIALEEELANQPDAYRIIEGEPELIDVVDVDLSKLTNDAEGPRIKSVKYTEFGPAVEICAPDAALINLARIHGLFEKDNSQKSPAADTVLKVEIVKPTDDDE